MVDHIFGIKRRQLIDTLKSNCARWAGRLAIAAEDAAQHVHIEHLRVALPRRNAVLLAILVRLDTNGIGGTRPSAQETAHAALQPISIVVQHVPPAKTRRKLALLLRVRYRCGFLRSE